MEEDGKIQNRFEDKKSLLLTLENALLSSDEDLESII